MSSHFIGKVFGSFTILSESHRDPLSGQLHYTCICNCKNTVSISIATLLSDSHRCDCSNDDTEKNNLVDSDSGNDSDVIRNDNVLEFKEWKDIISKCTDQLDTYYRLFGGRGIKVCDRWLNSFENFLEDMGPKPGIRYVVGRPDSLSNYEPNSCKWSTARCSRVPSYKSELYEYDGKSLTLNEIITITKSRLNGRSECNLRRRIKIQKMTIEQALSLPVKYDRKGIGVANGRRSKVFTHNGVSKTIVEWSKDLGISYKSLYYRLQKFGKDISKAIESFTSEKNNTLNM